MQADAPWWPHSGQCSSLSTDRLNPLFQLDHRILFIPETTANPNLERSLSDLDRSIFTLTNHRSHSDQFVGFIYGLVFLTESNGIWREKFVRTKVIEFFRASNKILRIVVTNRDTEIETENRETETSNEVVCESMMQTSVHGSVESYGAAAIATGQPFRAALVERTSPAFYSWYLRKIHQE